MEGEGVRTEQDLTNIYRLNLAGFFKLYIPKAAFINNNHVKNNCVNNVFKQFKNNCVNNVILLPAALP